MSAPLRPSFWEELRRRRVVRAISVYAVAAWVVVQVADVFFPALRMPDWTVTLVAALAVLGFPITIALAWLFDRTPEGVRRAPDTTDAPDDGPRPRPRGVDRRLFYALALGAVAGVLVVGTGFWLAGALQGSSTPGEESTAVAVLPFETVGTASATFTEGIHGDVLTGLSGIAGLDVISRGSVIRYRDPALPDSEIARELGVGWILRGEVQQAGDQVRVHARLVDARRDRQVWAEGFDRELTAANLFDIQREITRQIVVALESRLSAVDGPSGGRGMTDDLEALRLHWRGRELLPRRTEEPMRQAADYFRRAIERDPTFAAAWAGLADALVYLETFGYDLPAGAVQPDRAAERALELEPDLAEAHFALANLAHANRDNPEAVRRAERAIELKPSYSDAFNLLSWIHKQHGRPEAALRTGKRAVELHPLGPAPLSNLALAHLALGDVQAAVREAGRIQSLNLNPDFTTGTFLEALTLYHAGRFGEARSLLKDLDVPWAPAAPTATLALTELALGDSAAARRGLATLDSAAHPFSVALVRAGLGEVGPATEIIAGIERWEYWPTFAVRYFFPDVLRPLRRDPRYPAILRRVDRSWGA